MKLKKWIGFILVTMVLVATSAYARRGGGPGPSGYGPGFGPMWNPQMLESVLNLNADQMKKVTAIHDDLIAEIQPLQEKFRAQRNELHTLKMADPVDVDQVRDKLEEMSELRIDIQIKALEARVKMEQVLTPEQKTKLRQHMQQRYEMRKNRPGPGGGPGRW